MGKQVINVGASPNDGSGDFIRFAMQKANANFDELYGVTDGLGTGSTLATDTDDALTANSDAHVASQKATKGYVDKYAAVGVGIMVLSLFTAASAKTVPTSLNVVRTNGYSVNGHGSAEYVYDATVDSTYVAANPRTSFLTANSRGFRLNDKQLTVNWAMGGALGDVTTDDLPAMQAIADWWFGDGTVYRKAFLDIDGAYKINGTLNFGPSVAPTHFLPDWNMLGTMTLVQGQTGVWANINIQNIKRGSSTASINAIGYGLTTTSSGAVTFANRKTGVGISFNNSALACFNALRARGFWFTGVDFLSTGTLFDDDMSVQHLAAYECGSGFPGTRSLEGTWTAGAISGVSAGITQRQTINVSVFPDAAFDTAGNSGGLPSCRVRLNGDPQPYFVYAIDRTAGTATIYPWLRPAAIAGTGAFTWCFGGATRHTGGDSGVIHIGKFYAQGCGNGAQLHSLYGARIDSADINGCGTAVSISQSPDGTCLGYSLDAIYIENCTEDYVFQNRWGGNAYGYINSGYAPNFAKIWSIGEPTVTGGATGRAGGTLGSSISGEVGRVTFANNGRLYYYSGNNLIVAEGATASFNDQLFPPTLKTRMRDSQTIALTVQDVNVNRLFGYNGSTWRYVGTGTNGAPTGTFTFTPPSGGTINGGAVNAAAAFSTFTGPADFEIRHTDSAQLTWIVRCVAGQGLRNSNNLSDLPSPGTAIVNLGLGSAAVLSSDIDGTLAANSDLRIATQKAAKTYIDSQLIAATGNNTLNGSVKGTTSGTPGTGAFTPNAAATGCDAWSTVPTGWIGVVRFDDGSAWERSICYWNGTTLSRASSQVVGSSTGSLLTLTSAATALLVGDDLEVLLRPRGTGRLARHSWTPLPNATSGTVVGFAAPTVAGTAAAAALAATNFLTEQQRVQYTSATTASAMAGHRLGANGVAWVSATAGHGGYMFSARFGASQLPTAPRLFVGMSGGTWDSQTIEPSALVQNTAVFALDSTDTNIQLLTNSGSGGGTKIDTGIPLAANGWYRALIWNAPGSLTVYALLIRVDTGEIFFASTSTDVAVAGSTPIPQVFCGLNGSNTGTAAILHVGAVEVWG